MGAIEKVERVELDLDAATRGRMVESIVVRGDLSGLSPEDKAKYYVQRCRQLGLDPASKPFVLLRLNGKEILYAEKGAADQLAKIHNVTRKILAPPKVIDLAGRKLVYVECEASLPNGRAEYEVATVPLADPDNVLMKAVTKVKRRATLAILGLGMLDEAELETIPDRLKQLVEQPDVVGQLDASGAEPAASPADEDVHQALVELRESVVGLGPPLTCEQAASVWLDHRADLRRAGAEIGSQAWGELCAAVIPPPPPRTPNAELKRAVKALEARYPPPDGGGPRGNAPKPANGSPAEDDAERTAIEAEAFRDGDQFASAGEQGKLLAAIQRLKECESSVHVARHYAAHLGELPPGLRGQYREFAVVYLHGRYPKASPTRETAAELLARAVADRDRDGVVRRVA